MGILVSILSAVFATSKDIVSKKLSTEVDSSVSTFASFFFALPYYCVFLIFLYFSGLERFALGESFLMLVMIRALTDTAAEWLKMSALAHGDLSVVALFFSLSPVFLLFTSPLITGDPLSTSGVLATLFTVGGSLLIIYRPGQPLAGGQTKAILLATASAFFFSLNACFDRLAVQNGSPTLAGFAMTAASALFLLPLMFSRRGSGEQLRASCPRFLLRGFFEVAFMVSKLYAMTFLQAPYVVAILRVSVLFSIVSGMVVFKEKDFLRRLLAGVSIVIGVVVVGLGQ